jgi:type I restriction enzyme S subunit
MTVRWNRLAEFDELPSEWEEVPMLRLASVIAGQSPPSEYYNVTGDGFPFLQGAADFSEHFPMPRAWCASPAKTCKKGDILISVRAPVGEINRADQAYAIGRGLAAIRAIEVDSDFLYHGLHRWRKGLQRVGQGTTFDAVTARHFAQLTIPKPPREEQERIAQILDAVDTAIARTRDTLAKAERLKRGLLAKAFRDSSASQRKLKEFIIDIRYGTSQASNDHGWGYPTLRIPNVIGNQINTDDLVFVNASDKDAKRFGLHANDLLLVRTNGNPNYIGRSAVFHPPDDRHWLYASYLICVRLNGEVSPEYVNEFLNVEVGRRELLRRVTTSAGNYNINTKNIESIPVPWLDSDKQHQVVSLAKAANGRIAAAQHQIEVLQQLKRGLMQDLLTGRVRVTHKQQTATRTESASEAAAHRLKTSLAFSADDWELFRRPLLPSPTIDLLNRMVADASATNAMFESFARSNAAVFQQMSDSVARIMQGAKLPLATAKMIEEANRSIRMALVGIPTANHLIFQEVAKSPAWSSAFENLDQWGAAASAMQKHFAEIASVSNSAWERFGKIQWDALKEISDAVRLPQPSITAQLQTFSHSYTELQSIIGQRLDFVAAWPPEITRLPTVEMYRATDLAYTTSVDERDQEPATLDLEQGDELEVLLAKIDPNFSQLLRGAKYAMNANHPDRIRHFAASLRELITHVLHKIAPDEAVKSWSNEPQYLHDGKPTRRARILFICREIQTPKMSKFLEEDVKSTLSFIDLFQEGTHAVQPSFNDKQIKAMLLRAEGLLRYLIELARL